jgi:DME family drug/metabolite transporter
MRAGSSQVTWGWLLVLLAAVTWGTTGTTSRLLAGQAGAGPLVVGPMRLLVAAPLMLLASLALDRGVRRPGWGALLAGGCVAAYQLCFFSAVPLAGVAATALLAICTAPLMIALVASVALGEKLTRRVLVALVAGVLGAALLVVGANPVGGAGFGLGALLALGAGASYALYVVITKASLAHSPPMSLAAVTFSVAAVLLLPVLLLQQPSVSTIASGAPLFLYLGAVPTALAYAFYTSGMRHTSATAAGLAALLEPLTATILGVVLFGERLGVAGAAGAVLLVVALGLLSFRGSATAAETAPLA